MIRYFRVLLPAFALATMFISPARAEEQWKHTLVPLYLWASGIEGNTQVGPVAAPVSIEFKNALEHLDTALTVHYEGNKGQWGVLADVYHLSLAPEGVLPGGASAGVDLTNNIYELGGIYRPNGTQGLDLLFGLRGVDLEIDANIGSVTGRSLVDESWVDGFVGLRKNFALSDKASFTARGDVGAGGSNLVWNVALLLNYRFSEKVSMFGGYRWLDYDYETGSGRDRFSYDVTYEGPAIALSFNW